jgi:ubiquitin-conjugating enzyme E2 W
MILKRLWLFFALNSILWCAIWQENLVTCVQTHKISSTCHQLPLIRDKDDSSEPKSVILDHKLIKIRSVKSLLQLRGGSSQVSIISSIISSFFRLLQQIFGIKPPKKYAKLKTSKKSAKTGKDSSKSKSKAGTAIASASAGMARLQREMQNFLENPPSNCELKVDPKNIRAWTVTLTGAEGTVYANEKYQLQMNFPKDYPAKPPSVFFLKPIPKHQHVYTNGDICLNLLGRDWRPIMTAEGLAVSILSMLSSAKEKKLPQDNAMHAEAAPGQQQDNWMYHDDKC